MKIYKILLILWFSFSLVFKAYVERIVSVTSKSVSVMFDA